MKDVSEIEVEVRFTLRMPKSLHDALVKEAPVNYRSLNGEIVHRLKESLPATVKKKR